MSTQGDAEHEGAASTESRPAAGPEAQHMLVFADLAGFTALTEAHGDRRAVGVIEEFSRSARELLHAYDAEQVKAIGDALMLRGTEAAQAVRLGVRLVDEVGAQHGFPGVRVGIHTGPAIRREDDYFGATVNLAARVADAANAGELLLTGATRDAAEPALEGVQFRNLGTRTLKNVTEPIELFTVLREDQAGGPDLLLDPVCRMALDPARSHHHTGIRPPSSTFARSAAKRFSPPTRNATENRAVVRVGSSHRCGH